MVSKAGRRVQRMTLGAQSWAPAGVKAPITQGAEAGEGKGTVGGREEADKSPCAHHPAPRHTAHDRDDVLCLHESDDGHEACGAQDTTRAEKERDVWAVESGGTHVKVAPTQGKGDKHDLRDEVREGAGERGEGGNERSSGESETGTICV